MLTNGLLLWSKTDAFLASVIGCEMVESHSNSNASTLNIIWACMLGGLLSCFVFPPALRRYWGRMDGWGFAQEA